jgi:hypothetical protein
MYNALCEFIVAKVEVVGWGESDTFDSHLLKKKQRNSRRINVMLNWSKCIKTCVISKHLVFFYEGHSNVL